MQATTETHIAICPLCEATCGLEIVTEGHEVRGIRGDAADVFSHGYICPKGYALKALEEDPDRLRAPQIREGDQWRTASWDEAFDLIAQRLSPLMQAHGQDAVAVYLGNPNVHNLSGQLYVPVLLQALRTRNIYSASTLDQMPKQIAVGMMFGHALSVPIPDVDRTDYLLILGANPLVSNGSLMTAPDMRGRLRALRARGGKIVVIDPRRTRTADEASEHHFIRPGTDAYFLFALVQTLFAEDLVRPGRLAEYLVGIEAVADAARDFTPEAIAGTCGIPAETIRRLARELAAAPHAAVYGRLGTCTQEFGTLASWLVDVLNILTGNLDREGGAMFPRAAAGARNTAGTPGKGRGMHPSMATSRVRRLPQVLGEFPAVTLADEILTPGAGQVRALITIAGNPALSIPNGDRVRAALASLDFMVSVDGYLNETTRHAHVILPPPTHLERSHYDLAFTQLAVRNVVRYAHPVFPRREGQLDEWEIILRLIGIVMHQGARADVALIDEVVTSQAIAREMKTPGSSLAGREVGELLAALAPRRGPERLLDFLLRVGPYGDGFGARSEGGLTLAAIEAAPHGIDLGPLQPRIPEVLRTPSGQIELAPAPLLADVARLWAGLDRAPAPLVLIGRRDLRSNNSWMHNLPLLVKGPPICTLLMHPDDAARLGLAEGEMARITSSAGSVTAPVEVTASIMPGVVSLPHGWGHDQPGTQQRVAREHAGASANVLVADVDIEPLSGNAIQNAVPVTVAALSAVGV